MVLRQAEAIVRSLGVGVQPGEILTVMAGDTVTVTAEIDYRGPRLDDIFYGAIGERRLWILGGFDEVWKNTEPVHFDESFDWVRYNMSVAILITEIGLLPWTPGRFDLYVKLDNSPQAVDAVTGRYPELANVIEILLKAEFQNFGITGYEKI